MAGSRVEVDFLDVLDPCIADVRAGRKTIERCLDEFPQHRAELATPLMAAAAIVPLYIAPDAGRKLRARFELVEELHRAGTGSGFLGWLAALRPRLAGVALAGFLAVGGSGAAVVAAQDAQPTDPLYGLKTAIEQQQVALAASPDARAQLRVRIAERRLAEAERAIASGREDVAVSVAAAYSDAMQRAYQDIDLAETGGGTAAAAEAAEDTTARLHEVAARANDAGERTAATALLDAGERAERDRPGGSRKSTQPAAAQQPVVPVAQRQPPAALAAGLEPESEVFEVEGADDQPPNAARQPQAAPASAAVVSPQPVRGTPSPATAQGRGNQPGANAAVQRGAQNRGEGHGDDRDDDGDDDSGRGNSNNDRPVSQATAGGQGQSTLASPTSLPSPTVQPATIDRDRDDRDDGDERGNRAQNGQGRGDDDRRTSASPTRTPTSSTRVAPAGDDRPRPTATPPLRAEVRTTPVPTRTSNSGSGSSGSGSGGGDGDGDRR